MAVADWLLHNLAPFLVLALMVRWVMRPRFGKRGPVEILMLNAVGDLASHAAFEEQHPQLRGVGSVALWLMLCPPWRRKSGNSETGGGHDGAPRRSVPGC